MANHIVAENGMFLVVVDARGLHSLWPALTPVPTGWRVIHDAAPREICARFADSLRVAA